jgi:hypothetical protein
MVAVMIVSVVIAALLQLRGDTTGRFLQLKKMLHENQYKSFLISSDAKYGFESSRTTLKTLAGDFRLNSTLRRRLKAQKVKLSYDTIDDTRSEGMVFEMGKTSLKSKEFSFSLIRVRAR